MNSIRRKNVTVQFTTVKAVAVAGVLSALVGGLGFPYWTSDTAVITVTDKERVISRRGNSTTSKYLVFTETETFENTDCFAMGKFRSSDIQGRLKPGETYTVDVYGWRVPFLSAYRNIVRVRD